MRSVTTWGGAAFAIVLCALPAAGGTTASIELPTPQAARAQATAAICAAVGCTADRLKESRVPGPVVDDEIVDVGVDGGGTPQRVQLDQRLVLTGVGDYVIRERGPARSAVGLVAGADPPNTKLGAVLWQGFSPGTRRLGARLTLDAALEAPRLPASVTVSFVPSTGGPARPLGPGGRVPAAGTVTVRMVNQTAQPADLPTAADAPAAALAGPLEVALRAAMGRPGPRLPAVGSGLPAQLPVTGPRVEAGSQSVPLRVTGALRVLGAPGTVTGPGTTPSTDGAQIAGTLSGGSVTFRTTVGGAGTLVLDLTAVPTLDARTLRPPGHAPSWGAWARGAPTAAARRAALDLLVSVAATGARAASYSPYLGADLPGRGSTVFRYSFLAPGSFAAPTRVLHPQPVALTVAALAALLLVAQGAVIWRLS